MSIKLDITDTTAGVRISRHPASATDFPALKSSSPVLGNPANRNRAVPLTYDQFRFGFV